MSAILPHIPERTAFEPEAIAAMSQAFEEACVALRVFAGDHRGRQIVATRIIDLARNGLIDANALKTRVVKEAEKATLSLQGRANEGRLPSPDKASSKSEPPTMWARTSGEQNP